MEKRGMAMQFNWIFVLAAGAVILLVSAGFLTQYKKLQEEKSKIETLSQIENALDSLAGSSGHFYKKVSFLKEKKIETGCDFIRIDGRPKFWNKIVFGPKTIKTKSIMIAHYMTEPGVDIYYIIDEKNNRLLDETKNWDDLGWEVVGDKTLFECRQKKILSESLDIISILEKKAHLLQKRIPECNYKPIIYSLESIKESILSFDVQGFKQGIEDYSSKEKYLGGCPNVK